MIAAGAVDAALGSLVPLLDAGDVLVDGGNSHYHDDIRRSIWPPRRCEKVQICTTSPGLGQGL
jgi:6-phosphogluconate dehydrogenase